MATTAGRRRSSGSSAGTISTQAIAPAGMTTLSQGKRPSVSSSKSAGVVHRNRVDPSLMMSSKIQKSTDDVKGLAGVGGARQNKSSDRLHRMAAGSSSTNLASNKRSKSYSQIMSAGTTGNTAGKKKKKEVTEEDEEGWTSSSQKGTPDGSRSPEIASNDEDEEDDEGLIMTSKAKMTPKRGASNLGSSTPRAKTKDLPKQSQSKPEFRREDTQVTLRGFNSQRNQSGFATPSQLLDDIDDKRERDELERTSPLSRLEDTPKAKITTVDHNEQTTSSSSPDSRPSIDRNLSVTSGKTLTQNGVRGEHSSPNSIRSRSSIRSRNSLLPRESQGPIAPKLSTHYALAGALGSLQEESELEKAMGQQMQRRYVSEAGLSSSKSDFTLFQHRKHLDEDRGIGPSSRRKSSISNIQANTINLPHASPSMADVSLDAVRAESNLPRSRTTAFDSIYKGKGPSDANNDGDRRRNLSIKSLTAADAANLSAKLRMARGESYDDAHATSATKMLANSSSKYFAPLTNNKNDLASTRALKEYNKPTVSVFVKRPGERKNIEVKVAPGSLFDDNFTRASLGSKKSIKSERRQRDNIDDNNDDNDDDDEEEENAEVDNVRYVMDFGLNGPSVQKTATTEALLETLLDHDEFEATWAPALANAAGLGEGTRRAREAAKEGGTLDTLQMNGLTSTGGVAINGPNATPMHFLHGLTNTTNAPFPLDPSDMATTIDTAAIPLNDSGEYLDAKNLRAIAMTWTALNTNRGHIVTRRYVDPMRESLERIGRVNSTLGAKTTAGGITSSSHNSSHHHHHHHQYHHGGNHNPASGTLTPGGSNLRWGNSWRNLFGENSTLREES